MDHATSIILSLQVAPPLGGAPRLRQRSHTYPRVSIYQPILSLSLPLSLRVFTRFSYFPIHRSANVIVSLRSSSVGLPLLHFYVLFTSEVHVSLSGSLVHFAAALFPIFVLPRFVSVYRNICSSCEQDKREYFMHFRLRRKRGNTHAVCWLFGFCQFLDPSFSLSLFLSYAIEHRSQWQGVKRFSNQRRSCRLTPFAAPFMEFLLTRQSLLYMYTYLSRIPQDP